MKPNNWQKSSSVLGNPCNCCKNNKLMNVISHSGDATTKLVMTGDSKDARTFFAVKKREEANDLKPELSFVDSLFMMFKLRRRIAKAKAECKPYYNIRQYSQLWRLCFLQEYAFQIELPQKSCKRQK